MYYTTTTWHFICDGCNVKGKAIGDKLKMPEGWSQGRNLECLRQTNYNFYISNYDKDFCIKCVEKFEIQAIFK